jgi:hypothetical protein
MNATPRSEACSEMRAGRMPPSSMRLHRIRVSAQVRHGLPGPKGPSCRDRDKWCTDPLCRTLTFHIMFDFSRKETNSARSPKQMRKFRFSERCLYRVSYEGILLDSKPGR